MNYKMADPAMLFKRFFYLLRISHWSKAIFVLLGVIYAGSPDYFIDALVAALSFCLVASAVYIYNDLLDKERDRRHPNKCLRPLAAGTVSLDFAVSMLVLLLAAGLVIAWFISSTLAALLAVYLLINLAYNHSLRNVPVLDVLCIASGYMLRVLAGTIGIGLPISWWLALTAALVSLFIALCKRRLEKQLYVAIGRDVLSKYTFRVMDGLIIITALSVFTVYALYALIAREESFYFLLTLPFAAIGLWRFVWLTLRSTDNDDPVSLYFKDYLSRFNVLCFLTLTLLALFNEK